MAAMSTSAAIIEKTGRTCIPIPEVHRGTENEGSLPRDRSLLLDPTPSITLDTTGTVVRTVAPDDRRHGQEGDQLLAVDRRAPRATPALSLVLGRRRFLVAAVDPDAEDVSSPLCDRPAASYRKASCR